MYPSILNFTFDPDLGPFLGFWAIFVVMLTFKISLGSIHKDEKLLFSMYPSILNFTRDLNEGSFLDPNRLFWESGSGSKLFSGSTHLAY